MDQDLILDAGAATATITFNRPDKMNAIHPSWAGRIVTFLREIDGNPAVRCVLIRANGKHFQAGGDLDQIAENARLPEAERIDRLLAAIAGWNRMVRTIYTLRKPVVVSAQGGVIGGTIGLLAAADLVVAADDAFLFLAQPTLGSSIDGMPSFFLPRLLGRRKAMELALLGSRIKADEAKTLGLFNRVVPRAELEAETARLTAQLEGAATCALAANKALINRALDHDFDTHAAMEMDCYAAVAATRDWAEGIAAIAENRRPTFSGQ